MSEIPETHENIEKGIEKRRRESEGRARHMGLIVDDKKTVAHTTREVFLCSTIEAAETVKQALSKAAEVVHAEFEKQNKDLQEKIKICKDAEKKLDRRAKNAKRDAFKIEKGVHKLKESKKARRFAIAAEHETKKEGKYLDVKKAQQKRERKKSEKRRAKQKRQLMAATLKW